MRQTPSKELAPSEYWLSALACLSIIPLPLAIIIGGILFALRKRIRFAAYHGLQAAIWQVSSSLVINLILFGLLSVTNTSGGVSLFIKTLNMSNVSQAWAMTTFSDRVMLFLITLLPLINIVLAVWGTITVLRKRVFTIPFIGRYLRGFLPTM